MAILWSDDLATGINSIDTQHKELFIRINNLLEACNQGKGKEEVVKVIGFLEDYVITHFADEEQHMIKSGYPSYREHKAHHTYFMQNFQKLKNHLNAEGAGLMIIVSTNQLVVDWLKEHIRKVDRTLGEYLKTNAS